MRQFGDHDREKLEVLDGSRGLNRSRAAVRLEDLAGILKLTQIQASDAAGSTPTKAEYDLLLADLHRMHAALGAVAAAVQARLL